MTKTQQPSHSEQSEQPKKQEQVVKMEDLVDDQEKRQRIINLFWNRVKKGSENECWPWTGSLNVQTGYGQMAMAKKIYYAHRLSFLIHTGTLRNDLLVLHSCDNRPCVNPSHLSQGTHQDNRDDARSKGRLACGSRHGSSKLTETDVIRIRLLRKWGVPQNVLCEVFGIREAGMSQIINRLRWSHV